MAEKKEYTDKYLLNYLKKLAVKLGRTPGKRDLYNSGKVTFWDYYKRFGSLPKAQKAAGLVPITKKANRPKYSEYSDKFLLNYLKELAVTIGRTPRYIDIENAGKIYASIYIQCFGSLITAQEAAGLIPNSIWKKDYKPKFSEYSNKELLNHLKDLAAKLGRTPYSYDIDEAGLVKEWVYYKRWGSLLTAQKAAGLPPSKIVKKVNFTNSDILNYLKKLSVKLGRTPLGKDVTADGKIGIVTISKRFRKYSKALELAGLEPSSRSKKLVNEIAKNKAATKKIKQKKIDNMHIRRLD